MSVAIREMSKTMITQRDRIAGFIEFWIPLLGLEHWSIEVNYHGLPDPTDTRTNAAIGVMWEYMCARLDFYLPNFIEFEDGKVELIVVHELCHVLVNMMKLREGECSKNEERTVTHMAKAFISVRNLAAGAAPTAAPKKRSTRIRRAR